MHANGCLSFALSLRSSSSKLAQLTLEQILEHLDNLRLNLTNTKQNCTYRCATRTGPRAAAAAHLHYCEVPLGHTWELGCSGILGGPCKAACIQNPGWGGAFPLPWGHPLSDL